MRKLSFWLILFVLLLPSLGAWAQQTEAPTVGEERREEQRKQTTATRVSEVERGGALLPYGRLVIEPSFEYNHISGTNVSISGFTIFQAILIGRVQVQELQRDLFIPALTVRLGLKNAELYTRIPYFFRTDRLIFPESSGGTANILDQSFSDNGMGDITSMVAAAQRTMLDQ